MQVMPMRPDFEDFVMGVADADDSFDRPVFAIDFDDIFKRTILWNKTFPRIRPYYAMKCNDVPQVVHFMANAGVGFDCTSIVSSDLNVFHTNHTSLIKQKELEAVEKAGVSPDRIVFANPCKSRTMLRFARKSNVNLMTFDSISELKKVADEFPDAKLLLRLKVDDSFSKLRMGEKAGALPEEVEPLLLFARDKNLQVVGLAFHVGSGCESGKVFESAIRMSYESSLLLSRFGFNMDVLDVGGGFPGVIDFEKGDDLFFQMAECTKKSLEKSVLSS